METTTCAVCPREAIYMGTDVKYPEHTDVIVCSWHLHVLADGFVNL